MRGPGGRRGTRSCGARGRVEPRAPRVPSLSECSSFSPPTTVILLILLCFEGLLFLIFTSVMFGTQVHSICTDETVSTGAACHHSLHGWGCGAGGCLQVRPGHSGHTGMGPSSLSVTSPSPPHPPPMKVQSCPELCVTLRGTGVPFLSSGHGPGEG